MEHVVRYRTAGGEEHVETVTSLEAGLELIERLRNEQVAEDVRLYQEVAVQFQTYYKVAVAGASASSAVMSPAPMGVVTPEPVPSEPPAGAMVTMAPSMPQPEAVVDADAVENGEAVKGGRFSRS